MTDIAARNKAAAWIAEEYGYDQVIIIALACLLLARWVARCVTAWTGVPR